jgi:outer membrane receptor protein involved in Fe transport
VLGRATAITAALVLCIALAAGAGTTGKIAGRVTDASGNPLVGATVMIVGTAYGAMTDANGEFFIINLEPGEYNLVARMVGMADATINGVQVSADLTTRQDFRLNVTTVGSTVITVTDQRGMIMRDVTASMQVVGRDEIRTLPVAGIQDVVNRQAGATDRGGLHMRGGRSGEVVYLVDGVSQVDPTSNVFNSDIPLSAVAETSVMTGGFGAEYGNAQSGVINIVTREGGASYTGSLEVSGNDWQALGFEDGRTWQPLRGQAGVFSESRLNAEAAIGGPEPITSYLLPAMGVRVPGDVRLFVSGEFLETGGGEDGRYEYQFNNWRTQYSVNAKLTIRPNPRTKVNLTYYVLDRISGFSLWDWSRFETPYIDTDTSSSTYGDTLAWGEDIRYGLPTRFWNNTSYGVNLTQTLSDATFMEFKVNQYTAEFAYKIRNPEGGWLGEDWTLDEWLEYTPSRIVDTDGFYRQGASRYAWNYTRSTNSTARFDITSQINQQHQLKAGLEGVYYDIIDFNIDTASGGNIYVSDYHCFPNSGSVYVQDKMEYRGMIVNAGLRFDYFDPNFDNYPADPENPVTPGTTPDDPDHILNPIDVPVKYHLSPRVGFSHPITERDVLHFTYGHYFQMPMFDRLYSGSTYDLSGAFPLVGNVDLEPEETISYEVGVKHQFDDYTLMDVTGYYKDITGLVDTEKNFYTAVNAYDRYINGDYGNVRGAELTIMRRPSGFFSVSANYTYQVAKGKSSGATQNYSYLWAGWVIPKRESYLDWDQRHSVNANVDFRIPQGEGPRIGSFPILEGFGVALQFSYGSGFPYTQSSQGTASPILNGRRYPETISTDVKINRTIWAGPITLDLYCWIMNVFDRRDINSIADIAWYDADQDGDGNPDHDPGGSQQDPYVYSRPRMIRFGLGLEW